MIESVKNKEIVKCHKNKNQLSVISLKKLLRGLNHARLSEHDEFKKFGENPA